MAALEAGMLRMLPQPRLFYFVLNILDHCNLCCKGCDHFASIARKRFVSLEDIARDLARMSKLFDGEVTRIGIMGGEPLLHPQLKKILRETRKHFPETLIQLVTNGILLLKQDKVFWTVCRDNNIVIVNTKYPIATNYDAIIETAHEHKAIFQHYGTTGEQIKTSMKVPLDILGRQDPRKSFINCYHANRCVLLMEGKIYTCAVAPNIHIFNKKFGTNLELNKNDYMNIYKAKGQEEVLDFLCKPKPFCRFCNVAKRSHGHPWERSKREMSEWTI